MITFVFLALRFAEKNLRNLDNRLSIVANFMELLCNCWNENKSQNKIKTIQNGIS